MLSLHQILNTIIIPDGFVGKKPGARFIWKFPLTILLILFSCSSPLVLVPSSPLETIDRADYRDFDLYLTSFAVNDLEETEDINQVRLLKTRFFDYLKSQNQFHQIHDGPRAIGHTRPGLSLTVNITPQYTSHRTWFLEVITFYPFLGLWPITPHWGETTVQLSAQLVDMYGTLLKNIKTTKHMDYSSYFYAVYRSDHVQDAFRECYHLVFKEASTVLKNCQPQVTTYVDSVLFYRVPSEKKISEVQNVGSSLAVVELNAYGVSEKDALALSNRLTTEIFKTGRYTVLERDLIQEILTEQGFQQSGCTSSECLVEAGKLLNVQMIVGGSISKIGSFHTLELRLIDVETGKIVSVANEDVEGDIGDVLTKGVRRAAVKLVR